MSGKEKKSNNKRKDMDEPKSLHKGLRTGLRLSGEPSMGTEKEKINELDKEIKELLKTTKDDLGSFGLSKVPALSLKQPTAFHTDEEIFYNDLLHMFYEDGVHGKWILTKNLKKIKKLYKQVWDINKATKKELNNRRKKLIRPQQYWPPVVWKDKEGVPASHPHYQTDERRIYKVMPKQGIMSNSSPVDVMDASSLNKATHKELYPLRKHIYDKTKMIASDDNPPPRDAPSKFNGGRKTRRNKRQRKKTRRRKNKKRRKSRRKKRKTKRR